MTVAKESARRAVQRALRRGQLVRKSCEHCKTTLHVEAHHDDYSKPLDVRWLCRKHHDDAHRGDARPKDTRAHDMSIRFGQRCRKLRHGRQWSQMDMVRRFGLTLSYYQKVERGILDVRLSTAARLASAFGVTLSELLYEL